MALPKLSDEQMAAVDAVVLSAIERGRGERRGIAQAVSRRIGVMLLPHQDLDQHVERALQRLRAAGAIECVRRQPLTRGGRARWERRRAAA